MMFVNQSVSQLEAELKSLRVHRDKLVKSGIVPSRGLDAHMSRLTSELRKRRA